MREGDRAILTKAHQTTKTILTAGLTVIVKKVIGDKVGVYYPYRGDWEMTIVPVDQVHPTKTYEVSRGNIWIPVVQAQERPNGDLWCQFLDGSKGLATPGFWRVRN